MLFLRAVPPLVLVGIVACAPQPTPPESVPAQAVQVPNAAAAPPKQADPVPSPQPSKQPQTGPRALPLLLASATTSETQVQVELARDAPSEIDPGATFRVEIAAQLEDARLVLLDEQHAMVSARGTTDLGPITRFTLTPEPPLQPGTAYALRVDGAVAHDIHDHGGNAYAPVVFQLKTTGERPPPVAAPAKKGSRRRRGR